MVTQKSPTPKREMLPRPPATRTDQMTRGSTVPPKAVAPPPMTSEIQGWDDEYLDDFSEYNGTTGSTAPPKMEMWKGYQESTHMYKQSDVSPPPPKMESSPVSEPNMSLIDKLGSYDMLQKINVRSILRNEITDITGANLSGIADITE